MQQVIFSPDGRRVAFANGVDKGVVLGTWPGLKDRMVIKGHSGKVNSVAFSPDSKSLASGSDDGSIKLWALPTGK